MSEKLVLISIFGGDNGETEFRMPVSDARDVELLNRLSDLSRATAIYPCMPVIDVEELSKIDGDSNDRS